MSVLVINVNKNVGVNLVQKFNIGEKPLSLQSYSDTTVTLNIGDSVGEDNVTTSSVGENPIRGTSIGVKPIR